MKTIRALFPNSESAGKALDALKEAGFDQGEALGWGLSGVEIEAIGSANQQKLVVVTAKGSMVDTASVILKNGGAVEVETMEDDWEPAPPWNIAAFGRPTNS
jgi:hypothetical protein